MQTCRVTDDAGGVSLRGYESQLFMDALGAEGSRCLVVFLNK